ncbi:MAG: nuclear transport factor 2 family protein, partial [Acidobacteriota bacterium]
AEALFRKNVQAIRDRDREAYLSCYLASPRLVRTGPAGFQRGFTELADGTPATGSSDWPESLTPSDLRVTWVRPGLVYGTYAYVVVIDGEKSEGLSERVFIKTNEGWKIAVTTAFPAPPK